MRTHCCSAYLTFVALADAGGPKAVPTVYTAGDPVLERRLREADRRREHRLRVRRERQAAVAAESGGTST